MASLNKTRCLSLHVKGSYPPQTRAKRSMLICPHKQRASVSSKCADWYSARRGRGLQKSLARAPSGIKRAEMPPSGMRSSKGKFAVVFYGSFLAQLLILLEID
jgi:hypothetical protein